MSVAEMALRLGAGLALGSVIGMERQWRARGAGLRTNALVATGAALFVLLSAYGFDTGPRGGPRVADPTRVAAQIVSGIGFLGGGVILREGLNVRGLNTAATLWCAGAVGALAGAGIPRRDAQGQQQAIPPGEARAEFSAEPGQASRV